MSGPTKEPHELWDEAKGDPERYAALMVEHGHVVPFECPRCSVTKRHRHDSGTIVWTDIFGHDARAAAPSVEPRDPFPDSNLHDPDYTGHEGHEAFMSRGLCNHPSHAASPEPTPGLRERVYEAIERIVENELTGVPSWRIGLTNRLTDAALAASPAPEPTDAQIVAFAKALFAEVPKCTGCDFDHGWDDHVLAVARSAGIPWEAAPEIETLTKALAIGFVSYDGDPWYAKNAGYEYEDAEATLLAARALAARLTGEAER